MMMLLLMVVEVMTTAAIGWDTLSQLALSAVMVST